MDPIPQSPSSRPHHEVVAAALRREGRYLLGRRPRGASNEERWEFPGGKVRPGESHREGLARELREELGVEVSVGERLAVVEHAYPHATVRLWLYGCELVGGEPRARYHTELRWVALEELSRLGLAEADRELAAALGGGEG